MQSFIPLPVVFRLAHHPANAAKRIGYLQRMGFQNEVTKIWYCDGLRLGLAVFGFSRRW